MAPTDLISSPSTKHIRHISHSVSKIAARGASDLSHMPPLASIFAVIVRATTGSSKKSTDTLITRSPDLDLSFADILHPISKTPLVKRQNYILAIPTTYQGLNSGPAPGAVVGIVIGSIAGFILVLYVVLSLLRLYTGRQVIETEVIERRHKRGRSHSSHTHMSEPRRTRRETVIEAERVTRERSRAPSESVVVEEQEDDLVEVIEEHSPERRPGRRESKRTSGFRTVDPAEFGGGNRPMRKVSRR